MKDLVTYIEESNVLQIGDIKYACPNINFIADESKGYIYNENSKEFYLCEIVKGRDLYDPWKNKDRKLLARHIGANDPNEYICIKDVCDVFEFIHKKNIKVLGVNLWGSCRLNKNGNYIRDDWELNSDIEGYLNHNVNRFKEKYFESLYKNIPMMFKRV